MTAIEHGSELVTWNAQTVLGAVIDHVDNPLPPVWKKIIGRNAKQMLEDGMDPPLIIAASILALRRGRPDVVQYVAGDLLLAQTGGRIGRAEYEREIERLNQKRKEENQPPVCGACLGDGIVEISGTSQMSPCPACQSSAFWEGRPWTLVRAGVVQG